MATKKQLPEDTAISHRTQDTGHGPAILPQHPPGPGLLPSPGLLLLRIPTPRFPVPSCVWSPLLPLQTGCLRFSMEGDGHLMATRF